MDITTFVKLADRTATDELKAYGLDQILPGDFMTALADAQAEDRKQQAQKAAKEVLELLKETDKRVEQSVGSIREARRLIAQQDAFLKQIHRAREYGRKTGNFLPLIALTQPFAVSRLATDHELAQIPSDFVVDAERPKRKPATMATSTAVKRAAAKTVR